MIGLVVSDKKTCQSVEQGGYIESHNPGWFVKDTTVVREGSGETQ